MRGWACWWGRAACSANTLRIKPPMCVNAADVDFTLEVMDER